eukprot:5891042-Pyramimonas_sp.AAC.1
MSRARSGRPEISTPSRTAPELSNPSCGRAAVFRQAAVGVLELSIPSSAALRRTSELSAPGQPKV